MSEEIWKAVPGYEGLYQVSTFGRVKSLDRITFKSGGRGIKATYKGQVIKPCEENKRSYVTRLCKNNKKKTIKLHRLVAFVFIPNPKNKKEVNHIDGNAKNNHVTNLEWATSSENMIHAYRFLGRKHAMKNITGEKNKCSKPIIVIDLKTGNVNRYHSLTIACNETKSLPSKASQVCNGLRKTHNGLSFKYI